MDRVQVSSLLWLRRLRNFGNAIRQAMSLQREPARYSVVCFICISADRTTEATRSGSSVLARRPVAVNCISRDFQTIDTCQCTKVLMNLHVMLRRRKRKA